MQAMRPLSPYLSCNSFPASLITISLLFFCSLILFIWGVSAQEVIGFDSRFYLFAREMWQHGSSWFPMSYQQPYPDYPASSTFIIYLFSQLFGGINKWVAVLPSAMLAAATLVITYLIGSLHNKHWGFCAALFMLLTTEFVKSARAISLDMYPTFITALCFYLLYSADIHPAGIHPRDKENKPQRINWIYLLLIVSFVFRGPIGLVMPAGLMSCYYLINKNIKQFFVSGFIAFILLCVCTTLLLMLAYHVGGSMFVQEVLRMEILGRMGSDYLPHYFYFTNSFASYALAYPIAVFVLLGLIFYGGIYFVPYFNVYKFRQNYLGEMKLLLPLLGWAAVILLGMSIPGDKKVRYILPMMPAIALLAAYPFVAPSSLAYFALLRSGMRRILLFFPLMLLVLAVATKLYLKKHNLYFAIHFTESLIIFSLMQIINLIACYFYLNSFNIKEKIFFTTAAISFITATVLIIEPILLQIDKARDFVMAIETQRVQQHAQLAFYREGRDGLPIKYLANMPASEQPIFIANEKELVAYSGNAYFITSQSYYDELSKGAAARFRVTAQDTMGHVSVVALVKKQEKSQ
jgi:4-amino-4-deoxy-L-arabinose transferase-like glycosyltransferase